MRDDADQVRRKRRQLATIKKETLIDLLVELSIYADSLLDGIADGSRPRSRSTSSSGVKLTKAWTAILRRLSNYKHFRAADIIFVSQELQRGGEINRIQTPGGARAQLCHLAKKGMIKRLGGGNYRVTEPTKNALEHSRR